VESALAGIGPVLIDLLYSDQEGGQRTISRFSISRLNTESDAWFPSVVRHWYSIKTLAGRDVGGAWQTEKVKVLVAMSGESTPRWLRPS